MSVTPLFRCCTVLLTVTLAACGGSGSAPEAAAPATPDTTAAPAPAAEAPAAEAPAAEAAAPAPADAAAPAAEAAAPAAASADANGEAVYMKTCAMCHATPALGAPVKGNKEDWAPRIAQGKDMLYQHALEGYTGPKGMMPARGGNPSLDDASVKAAVDFMVGASQ